MARGNYSYKWTGAIPRVAYSPSMAGANSAVRPKANLLDISSRVRPSQMARGNYSYKWTGAIPQVAYSPSMARANSAVHGNSTPHPMGTSPWLMLPNGIYLQTLAPIGMPFGMSPAIFPMANQWHMDARIQYGMMLLAQSNLSMGTHSPAALSGVIPTFSEMHPTSESNDKKEGTDKRKNK
jgi:hypothetical protein